MDISNLSKIKNYKSAKTSEYIAVCKKTGKGYLDYKNLSGVLTRHLGEMVNTIDEHFYIIKNPYFKSEEGIQCQECGSRLKVEGGAFRKHIRSTHALELGEYFTKYPEERKHFSTEIEITTGGKGDIICKHCNKHVQSRNGLAKHLRNQHSTTLEEYFLKYHYKDEVPRCRCGCGQNLEWSQNHYRKSDRPYYPEYINGHAPNPKTSKFEDEVHNYLKEQTQEAILRNTKLNGVEIDILLPDRKIGIECNGNYWHSTLRKPSRKYHLGKKLHCAANNVRLLHIWEVDWYRDSSIWKSILRTILKRNDIRIYARKCKICRPTGAETEKFLRRNHLQGATVGCYAYGLRYGNELTAVMTFTPVRGRASNSNISGDSDYELVRFAVNPNCSVVGGASRLLKAFIRDKRPSAIVTYADYDWSEGNLYKKLDFKYIGRTKPGYFYVKSGEKYNRSKFTKSKLIQQGYDEALTESEIMTELGYLKIWNCGSLKFKIDISTKTS